MKCDCIIPAKLNRSTGQPFSLGQFLSVVGRPTACFPPRVTNTTQTVRQREIGIEFDGLVEEPQRFTIGFVCLLMKTRHTAEKIVVCIQFLCWFSLGTFNLSALQLWRNLTNNTFG